MVEEHPFQFSESLQARHAKVSHHLGLTIGSFKV
jgi:hypothetical protein